MKLQQLLQLFSSQWGKSETPVLRSTSRVEAEYEKSTAEYKRSTADYKRSTSGVQAEYEQSTAKYKRSTSEVQRSTSGVQPRSRIPVSQNDRNRSERSRKITVSGRKLTEIDGNRKQYSESKNLRISPATSDRFPLEKSEIFPTLNIASKLHRFPELFGRTQLVRFDQGSGVQRSTSGVQRSTSGVQAEYSAAQVEYKRSTHSRCPAFFPLPRPHPGQAGRLKQTGPLPVIFFKIFNRKLHFFSRKCSQTKLK